MYQVNQHWLNLLVGCCSMANPPYPPWETNHIMKSAKKVRALTVPKAKVKKTSAKTTKTSAAKKKTDIQVAFSNSKTQSSRTRSKDSPKPGKSRVNHAKKSCKTKESPAQKQNEKGRRHHRKLSSGEYDTFVNQTAATEKVSPVELVTIDRRKDKSTPPEQPAAERTVAEHEPQFVEKQDRRQKIQRRRQIDPTTCERDYSQEEIEFMNALDEYKRNSGRMFPTCSEILEVFRILGYAKRLHEESIEISASAESGNISVTATETGTMRRTGNSHLEMSWSQE